MNTLNKSQLNILDLPNEILLIIFNKLNMVSVLYSLVDVCERFDQLVLDPIHIHNLDMTSMIMKSFFDRTYSIDNHILDRICVNILPRIHHQVDELIVEQQSIELILHTMNYPQLYSLSLMDFQAEKLLKLLTEDATFRNLLTEQITYFKIDLRDETMSSPISGILSDIFDMILCLCKRLIKLDFCEFDYRMSTICTFNLSTNCMSSTLTALKIRVKTFNDCLYLLDGRLDSLSTLIIIVEKISYTLETIDNTKKLPKLKYFSLTSFYYIFYYDNLVIPLLRRMINPEELILFLEIIRINSNYIDGIQLYDDILIYMPQLHRFTFSIKTRVVNENNKIILSSNEDIQRSFIGKGKIYGEVSSYVEPLPLEDESRCCMYSLPYEFENFHPLSNSYQHGMFHNVRVLMMRDSHPFEPNFFKIISQDFPLLTILYIINFQPQKEKQQSTTLITFPHLVGLIVSAAHVDYAEQFLVEENTHLPRLLNLRIRYKSLAIVTNSFTNNATRLTCAKLTNLQIVEPIVRPVNFDQYFPLL